MNLKAGSSSALPDLVTIANGDATRAITIAELEGAAKTGVRIGAENIESDGAFRLRWDVLEQYGLLAANGQSSIPVARTFSLKDWREALDICLEGRARGKLVLVPRD